jgi:ribosomal protein S14
MNKDLEKKMIDEFPTFFKDMYGDMTKTCMHWGCAHGDGWFKLLHDACKKIAKLDKDKTFYFLQIKEKFGGLRLYYSGGNEKIGKIIDDAEKKSYKTCEHCGTKRNVTTEGSWILTLCKTCREKA